MEQDGTYQWVPNNSTQAPKPPKKPVNPKKVSRIILAGILLAVVLVGALTCFYTVDDKQQGVVTTFGRVTDTVDPGLHFKMPFGIQQVYKVDVNVYQKIELGYVKGN